MVTTFRIGSRRIEFAIVDEVDSVLVDDARTPLIISVRFLKETDRNLMFLNLLSTELLKFRKKQFLPFSMKLKN
jgi:preprotein translocase subunit SecA